MVAAIVKKAFGVDHKGTFKADQFFGVDNGFNEFKDYVKEQ